MNIYPISTKFIINIKGLTWNDCYYAYKHNLISIDVFIEFALKEMDASAETSDQIIELAGISVKDIYTIQTLVEKIACTELHEDFDIDKWLYITLFWVFSNRDQFVNLQEAIDGIYSDFNYSEEIKHMVSYMPCEGEIVKIQDKLINYLRKSKYAAIMNSEALKTLSISKIK